MQQSRHRNPAMPPQSAKATVHGSWPLTPATRMAVLVVCQANQTETQAGQPPLTVALGKALP